MAFHRTQPGLAQGRILYSAAPARAFATGFSDLGTTWGMMNDSSAGMNGSHLELGVQHG